MFILNMGSKFYQYGKRILSRELCDAQMMIFAIYYYSCGKDSGKLLQFISPSRIDTYDHNYIYGYHHTIRTLFQFLKISIIQAETYQVGYLPIAEVFGKFQCIFLQEWRQKNCSQVGTVLQENQCLDQALGIWQWVYLVLRMGLLTLPLVSSNFIKSQLLKIFLE